MADGEPSANRNKATTLTQRVAVCKLIDPKKNGSRKLKVNVALVAAGLKASDDRGPRANAVSNWLQKWRREDRQEVSAVSPQLRCNASLSKHGMQSRPRQSLIVGEKRTACMKSL